MTHTPQEEQDAGQRVLLRSHLERCLQDIWTRPDLNTDADGDYPFRRGSAMCWVSLPAGPVAGVRVFAHAAAGLKASAKLLADDLGPLLASVYGGHTPYPTSSLTPTTPPSRRQHDR